MKTNLFTEDIENRGSKKMDCILTVKVPSKGNFNGSTFRRHHKLYASCVVIKDLTTYDIDRKEEN